MILPLTYVHDAPDSPEENYYAGAKSNIREE
jgi:hypothetical protein